MNHRRIYIDTSLLMLLVVGLTGKEIIPKHGNLQIFNIDDYEKLIGFLRHVDEVLLTPNVLTEASILLAQHRDPEKSRILETLRALIHRTKEIVVSSQDASNNRCFIRLGLTDAVLLEVASRSTPLVTTDFDLYHAAISKDGEAAFNFRHFP